jgi:hypothetical protein
MGAGVVLRRQGTTMLRRAGIHARHFSSWRFLFHADDFFNVHRFKNAALQL